MILKYEIISSTSIIMFLFFMPLITLFALTHVKNVSAANKMYSAITTYPGDLYEWGNCTWWVSMRRAQINDPIPNSWGNAATWSTRAVTQNYLVDHNPTVGSIMQISNVDHGLGHVAFVESVGLDGTWIISEMNTLGLDIVDYKSEPSGSAINFNFIHDKIF
ncbi:MAG TPA: CHAP domain-containing protein [Patescibacteria group bacterium]|nr:CHAP domain-containing protein [Patescibacteria group bacterium]